MQNKHNTNMRMISNNTNRARRIFANMFFVGIVFVNFFAFTHTVFAANDYVPLTTIPGAFEACNPDNGDTSKCKTADPTTIITRIYSISIGIAAILAVIMIIWGGIQYATTEAIDGKSGAKDHIQSAFWGLLLLVGSYLILRTINSQLVDINLDLGTPVVGNIVTGGDVYATMLNNISREVEQKTTSLRVAEQNLQISQSNLTNAQKALDEAKKTGDTTKIALAQKTFDETKIQNQTNQNTQLITQIDTASSQNTKNVVSALQAGEISTAKTINKSAEEVIQTKINALETSEAPQEIINNAVAKKITDSAVNNQQIYIAEKLDYLKEFSTARAAPSKLIYQNYNFVSDTQIQQKIIEARQGLTSQYSATSVQIRATDPNQVATYSGKVSEQLKNFDIQVAQIINCPSGINVTSTNVTCK